MKTILTLAIFFAYMSVFGQNSEEIRPCSTMDHRDEFLKNNPNLLLEIDEFERRMFTEAKGYQNTERAVRVIPVVVHVVHENGSENISKAQILDQIRILNEDFSRTNPDAVNTPAVFAAVAGSPDIEFRLANIDPQGNCTDGIKRLVSPLTNNATDDVKALSYWDSDQYLNMWIVKSIESDAGGTTLGYAQFPGGFWADPLTDGVVIRHDCIGTLGTAATSSLGTMYVGRTATHEVGHWLGLRHIWGDSDCGDDNVDDTPPAASNNTGCSTFPHGVGTCNGNEVDGEMFMNYMDYSNGICENMFSQGQCDVMDWVLDNSRSEMTTNVNLIATGTDDLVYNDCQPIADFSYDDEMICEGDSITFIDNSWNGEPSAWSWSFEGGTPDVSGEQYPVIKYLSAGLYQVDLNVSNMAGSDNQSSLEGIIVSSLEAEYSDWHFGENFESETTIGEEWIFKNDSDNGWEYSEQASSTGSSSMMIKNHNGNAEGSIDAIISPSLDLTAIGGSPKLFFDYAYRKMSVNSNDRLKIYVSSNCGRTWSLKYNKAGSFLETVSTSSTAFFTPTSGQWGTGTVSLSSLATKENVRIKFEFESSLGNNIWLDNININDPNSMEDFQLYKMEVYPNPNAGNFMLNLDLQVSEIVSVELMDGMGKLVSTPIVQERLDAGPFSFKFNSDNDLSNGIYFLKVKVGSETRHVKMIIQK